VVISTDCIPDDTTEILLKVALKTITLTPTFTLKESRIYIACQRLTVLPVSKAGTKKLYIFWQYTCTGTFLLYIYLVMGTLFMCSNLFLSVHRIFLHFNYIHAILIVDFLYIQWFIYICSGLQSWYKEIIYFLTIYMYRYIYIIYLFMTMWVVIILLSTRHSNKLNYSHINVQNCLQ
jgi:hypothetical protein